ncbi:uncharacterized protein LOC108739198 isoform X1 [Agrilus planipennis]|uniref:Uncharacterized protein LOC108739198 isoform X1 n=1 Tax=Agrilus planipennis TaxID=224129 RepID=A0A1W4X818_AGRPL|nr:uncharacterized protein LOC108739198 isoform X1 [Agrilus planipennis]XP_018328486.1 uncharacterized protein LOC108739198 isoform X1 [Agrilus planipennis]
MNVADLDSNYTDFVPDIARSENFGRYEIVVKNNDTVDGYMGEPTRLTLKGSTKDGKNKALHLFCKAAAKHEFIRRSFPVNDVFKREKFLYNVVLAEFRKFETKKGVDRKFTESLAKCFRADDNEMNERIVLEDISKKGFYMLKGTGGLDDHHLRISLEAMGRFHALSFAYRSQQPEKFKLLEKGATNIQKHVYTVSKFYDILEEKCKRTADLFDSEEDTLLREKFEKFVNFEAKNWIMNIPEAHNNEMAILHGDCWSNNLLFHYMDDQHKIPDRVAFIDWQHSRLGSPAIELSYFLFTACTEDAFDQMHNYLKIYHDSLSGYLRELGSDGDKLFPFSLLETHWKIYLKFGLILSTVVIHSMVLASEEEDLPIGDFENPKGKLTDVFLFEKATKETNARYKERIRRVIKYCVDMNYI